jgi:serine/threonine-protein kinase ATR
LHNLSNEITAAKWYLCMPQLVSRVGHRNPDTVDVICDILLKIMIHFPQQVMHLKR